jgi:hypothetical protein
MHPLQQLVLREDKVRKRQQDLRVAKVLQQGHR